MTTPSLVASANASVLGDVTASINKPTGTLSGHAMLMLVCADGGSIASCSGWTAIQSDAGYTVLGKIAGGSEPSSYSVTLSAECDARLLVCTFQDVDAADFPHQSAKATSSANAPSVTTTKANCLLILIGLAQGNFTTQPAGTTSIAAISLSGAKGINAASKEQAAAGASGTNAFGASRDWTATVALTSEIPVVASSRAALPLGMGTGGILGMDA